MPSVPPAGTAPVLVPKLTEQPHKEVSDEDRKLAVSDDLTAAETTGWTASKVAPALAHVGHVEGLARFGEMHGVVKPVLRALSLVAKTLSDTKVLKVFEGARYGFGALASLATGFEQYEASVTKTSGFRKTDAVIAGLVDFAFGVGFPVIALADGVLNFVLPKLAPELKLRSGGFISGNLATAVRGGVALLEGLVTGDYGAARTFRDKAMHGDYGVIFEGGVKAAQAMASAVRRLPFANWLSASFA